MSGRLSSTTKLRLEDIESAKRPKEDGAVYIFSVGKQVIKQQHSDDNAISVGFRFTIEGRDNTYSNKVFKAFKHLAYLAI